MFFSSYFMFFHYLLIHLVLSIANSQQGPPRPDVLPFPETSGKTVTPEEMNAVYHEVKTPFKYGVVLRGEKSEKVDGPKVFRHHDEWFMVYSTFREETGYETCIASSSNLLDWEKLGTIIPFRKGFWDAWQAHGAPALVDYTWAGSQSIDSFEGNYWMTYVGGARKGYETDPLSIGLAWSDSPTRVKEWKRKNTPILSPMQQDARPFESTTLYTSTVIRVDPKYIGYPFIMYYNGKEPQDGHEAIGMAVSKDMANWVRMGSEPVVDNQGTARWALSGNPQIVKIGNLWVMFYFGAFWKPDAFDTFACSYDLINWTKWNGNHLVKPSEPYDRQFAHKPWVLKHNGVVYHFYCAVGDEGRVIALATSKDLRD